uniref:Uncharacterized protein n=1 Tax=Callorhinchus milii TaxID=7868 RepID=A0A4W3J7T6_CALMI
MRCSYYPLLWQLTKVLEDIPCKSLQVSLQQQVTDFCQVCREYLSNTSIVVQEQAFVVLCDLLMVFSHEVVGSEQLPYLPEASLQSELLAFVLKHVFGEQQEESHSAGQQWFQNPLRP